MYLDNAIQKLLERHQIQAIQLKRKPTLEQAKENRKKTFLLEIFKEYDRRDDSSEGGGDKGGGGGAGGDRARTPQLDGNFSKQQIMFEELDDSPTKARER